MMVEGRPHLSLDGRRDLWRCLGDLDLSRVLQPTHTHLSGPFR